jgi:hypothetical protein
MSLSASQSIANRRAEGNQDAKMAPRLTLLESLSCPRNEQSPFQSVALGQELAQQTHSAGEILFRDEDVVAVERGEGGGADPGLRE